MSKQKVSSEANKVVNKRQVLPLIGPALEYFIDSARTTEIFFRECGSLGRFSYIGTTVIAAADPSLINHILKSRNYCKVKNNKRFARAVGDGLLTSEGRKWLDSRRVVQPVFSSSEFYSLLLKTTVEVVEETKKRWHQLTKDGPVNIKLRDEMNLIAFRVGLKMLFGKQDIDIKTIKDLSNSAIQMKNMVQYNPFRILLGKGITLPGLEDIRFILAKRRYNKIIRQMIAERMCESDHIKERNSYLFDYLMAATRSNSSFTNSTVETEAFTLAFAITVSTAVALQWMWVLFDRHHQVTELIRKLTKDSLSKNHGNSTESQLVRYELLCNNEQIRACIKEVLRLYPPFWYQARKAIEADSYNGLSIEKNTAILINVLMLHRSPDLWSHPNSFDHTRFLESAENQIPEGAYIPFGGGSRACPAAKMATMEMAMVATGLIEEFNVFIQNPVSLRATKLSDLLLEPEHPILAQISRVHGDT